MKMKTYRFNFCHDKMPDEVEFCGRSLSECLNLFRAFIFDNRWFFDDIDILSITKVYNKYDHEYYGDDYDICE